MSAADNQAGASFRAIQQIQHAHYYVHLTACAQGIGFPSISDALSALTAILTADPTLRPPGVRTRFGEVEQAGKGGAK